MLIVFYDLAGKYLVALGLLSLGLIRFFHAVIPAPQLPLGLVKSGEFLIVTLMVAQLSFWGNYLPRMYPTHLRGTGESVATNIGGRLIGTSAAIAVTTLSGLARRRGVQLAATACAALAIYAIAFVAVRWLPEPAAEALPE
jgi:hypothetical protein